MKKIKYLFSFLAISGIICTSSPVEASTLKEGIDYYRTGNYIACIQSLTKVLQADPSNSIAYYYIGMSNAKMGDSDNAIAAYNRVIKLNTNPMLTGYAVKGKACLTDIQSEDCKGEDPIKASSLTKDINYLRSHSATPAVESTFKQIGLDTERGNLNRRIEDEKKNQKIKSKVDEKDLVAEIKNEAVNQEISDMPTDAEIGKAVRTLAKIGYNPFSANMQGINMQNPEMASVYALMGSNNNNNSSSYMNMLPFLLAQKDSKQSVSPEMIKTMMMSSIMNGMDFSSQTQNQMY